MHEGSILRMEWFKKNYLQENKTFTVLDVGSYGINGTYREIFSDNRFSYTGLDIVEGPNVDYVPKDIYNWKEMENDKFDVVISGQAFEHIEFFWLTMQEIARVVKKGGYVCIIAPSNLREHRFPFDCWRFYSDGMVSLARWTNLKVLHVHTNCGPNKYSHKWFSLNNADSILIAQKEYSGIPIFNIEGYTPKPLSNSEKYQELISGKIYYRNLFALIYISLTSTMNFIAKISRFISRNLRQNK